MNTEQERELFQSEYMKLPGSVSRQYLVRHALHPERYQYESVQIAWELWQVRATQSSSRIEKDLIIELAVLEGKYAAVCDDTSEVTFKMTQAAIKVLVKAKILPTAAHEELYLHHWSSVKEAIESALATEANNG